jgi:aminopeptidase
VDPLTRSFEQQLDALALLALRIGVGFTEGDRLRLGGPLEAAPLVRRITALAYDLGAAYVDVRYTDGEIELARALHAPCETLDHYPPEHADLAYLVAARGDAAIHVTGADPDLMSRADPARVKRMTRAASRANRRARELGMRSFMPWTIVPSATPAWARKVFPGGGDAVERLWHEVFAATRATTADPVAAWEAHAAELDARARRLSDAGFVALHLRAPGTDLRVALCEGHVWEGASATAEVDGRRIVANIPTEEVFTAPHARRVDGVVRATKPLSYHGQIIDGFSLTFDGGAVVDASAERGQAVLDGLLETDAGARRLGEVALVPHSSPISRSGRLFYNTLFDENAACHLALGDAYRTSVRGGLERPPEELEADGLNRSLVHVDFMLGSSELDVDGVRGDGEAVPVMRGGEWAIEDGRGALVP